MKPFLPGSSRILLLGSFPLPVNRWSMDFYYPNFQNDMWRIMGLIFFNKDRITTFCEEKGIALYDTVAVTGQKAGETLLEVIRENGFAGKLSLPAMGNYVTFLFRERTVKLYRMPSTSRAYPMSLEKKASYYRTIIPTLW